MLHVLKVSFCAHQKLPPAKKLRQGNVFIPVCHSVRGGACVLGVCMPGGGGVAGESATAAGGTHPTGMHSCSTDVSFSSLLSGAIILQTENVTLISNFQMKIQISLHYLPERPCNIIEIIFQR